MHNCLGEGLPTRRDPQNQGDGPQHEPGDLCRGVAGRVGCGQVSQEGRRSCHHLGAERSPGLFMEHQEAHRLKAEAGRSVASSGATGSHRRLLSWPDTSRAAGMGFEGPNGLVFHRSLIPQTCP